MIDSKWILGGIGAAIGIAGGAIIFGALTGDTVTVQNPKISVTCFNTTCDYGKNVIDEARRRMSSSDVSPILQLPLLADKGKVRYVRASEGLVFFSTDPENLTKDKFTPNVKVVNLISNRILYMQVPWSRFALFIKYFNSLSNILAFSAGKNALSTPQKKGNRR